VSGKRYVLDSFAVLAYLQDEPGAQVVEALLAHSENVIMMCTINLGEVYYITHRERGEAEAERVLLALEQLPIREIAPDRALVLRAARIKAQYAISYADAFVAALAEQRAAIVVTGDREFERLPSISVNISVKWLPQA
jgi:ribonuclease VapC